MARMPLRAGRYHTAPQFVVGSGSLPPGVPNDFYARVAVIAQKLGAKFFLDTSAPPLAAAMRRPWLDQAEPQRNAELIGAQAADQAECVAAARRNHRRRTGRDRSAVPRPPWRAAHHARRGLAVAAAADPAQSQSAPATAFSAPWCSAWQKVDPRRCVAPCRGGRRRGADPRRRRGAF